MVMIKLKVTDMNKSYHHNFKIIGEIYWGNVLAGAFFNVFCTFDTTERTNEYLFSGAE